MRIKTTVSIITDGEKILLAMKKRGHGVGKWNGYGGKISNGETIDQAMVRELVEESGLTAISYDKQAIINFEDQGKDLTLETHIYKINEFKGIPVETEEMAPKWFDIKDIPYEEMWESDRKWLPMFLEGKMFVGNVIEGDKRVEEFNIVNNLEEIENATL